MSISCSLLFHVNKSVEASLNRVKVNAKATLPSGETFDSSMSNKDPKNISLSLIVNEP